MPIRSNIVQLPFWIFSMERLPRPGLLDRLRCDGIQVHTRSAFLQGASCPCRSCGSPQGLSGLRGHHHKILRALEKSGVTPSAASLRFCL